MIKGYKGTDKDMKCRDMQYEIGKTYQINGSIGLCKRGFHFCKNLRDVFRFYRPYENNRFFEIEAGENTIVRDDKCVTSEIKFVRELSVTEINRWKYGYGNGIGSGYGHGHGHGYGYRDSYRNGDGCGAGYGYSDGSGYGDSYGDRNGNGDGDGDGYNIQKILEFI